MKTELLLGAGALYLLLKSRKRKKEPEKESDAKTYKDIALQEVINLPENQRWLEKSQMNASIINTAINLTFLRAANLLISGVDKVLIGSNENDEGTKNAFTLVKDFISTSAIADFIKKNLGGSIGEMVVKPFGRIYMGFEDLRKYAAAIWFYDGITVLLSQKFTHYPLANKLTINDIATKYPTDFRLYDSLGRRYILTKDENKNNANLPGGHYFIASLHYFRPLETLERLITILDEFDIKKLISEKLIPSKPIAILSGKNLYTTVDP